MISAERLREMLDYNALTGVFVWKVSLRYVRTGEIAGRINGRYRRVKLEGRVYQMHRLAWLHFYGEWPIGGLDHKDGNTDHNWIRNLRVANQSMNSANRRLRRDSLTGMKGVGFHRPTQKWHARIQKDGKRIKLGYFDTPAEAHAAYVRKAKEWFGEFARAA